MKRNTAGHPKTLDLQARLGLRRYQVMGVLEALWHFTAHYARRGDIGKYTDAAIAEGIGWDQEARALIDALVGAGFVDRCSCHRLRIHDWPDHTDQSVSRSVEVKRLGWLPCYPKKLAGETSDELAQETSLLLAPQASQPLPLPLPEPLPEPLPLPARQEARAGAAWVAVLSRLAQTVPERSWGTWLKPTVGIAYDGDELQVSVPSSEFRTWIAQNYREPIAAAMEAEGLGHVRLVLVSRANAPPRARTG